MVTKFQTVSYGVHMVHKTSDMRTGLAEWGIDNAWVAQDYLYDTTFEFFLGLQELEESIHHCLLYAKLFEKDNLLLPIPNRIVDDHATSSALDWSTLFGQLCVLEDFESCRMKVSSLNN